MQGVEMIIQACKKNQQRYPGARDITPYEHFLARLAALLHDLAQMAYGHTLKDEGHVLQVEWNCKEIRQMLISPEGLIPHMTESFLRDKWQKLPDNVRRNITIEQFVEYVRLDLEWVLTAGISNTGEKPPNEYLAFISDIVGNTLSGDLLDYAQRDYASLGMSEHEVSLIPLEFVIIKDIPSDKSHLPRLVLTLWKPSKPEKMRKDVERYAIDLFDKRCRLAENVYFHHAKTAASAMLIKAIDLSGLCCEEIWKCGDLTLLDKLAEWKAKNNEPEEIQRSKVVRSLAQKLLRRHLFKSAFECCYAELEQKHLIDQVLPYCDEEGCNKKQREFEKTLISYFPMISEDQVAAYCPDPDMNLKPFETLVWPTEGETIKQLKQISDASSIEKRHRELWSFTVFIDPDVLTNERCDQLHDVCRNLLFDKEPQYQLARIWVDNYEAQLEESFKSKGVNFTRETLKVAREEVAKLLQPETRRRGTVAALTAPSVEKVVQLMLAEGKVQ
jgi:HD superfamily phosphohydrolase